MDRIIHESFSISVTRSVPPYSFLPGLYIKWILLFFEYSIVFSPVRVSCSLRGEKKLAGRFAFWVGEVTTSFAPGTGNFLAMDHKETGCQAPPEAPKLCANNCGFFGSAATMNLCSKCHKDLFLKQQQAELAAASIGNIVNGNSSGCVKEPVACPVVEVGSGGSVMVAYQASVTTTALDVKSEPTVQESAKPNRCSTCRKRVGLTGFNCRCGNVFCAAHRYSEKHGCPYDYRTAGQDAIAKANPVVKADKLDKI